jgi:putative DNA methylase
MALQAVLEVLPISARYNGYDPVKNAIPSASDFEALEDLRRLDLKDKVPEPQQLQLDLPEAADASSEMEVQP